jgi:hypothetical protein
LLRAPQEAAWHCTAVEQVHAPSVQMGPGLHVVVQSLHTPLVPHAKFAVPTTQTPVVPAAVMEQQPPLHGCAALHAVVHACTEVSHACPVLQSAAELQPHAPPGKHAVPLTEVAQFWQTLAAAPQAALDVPAAQVPAVPVVIEQHPLLHG